MLPFCLIIYVSYILLVHDYSSQLMEKGYIYIELFYKKGYLPIAPLAQLG